MQPILDIIITIVLAVLAWYIVQYVGALIGLPGVIITLAGILIFLYVVVKVISWIQNNPPRL